VCDAGADPVFSVCPTSYDYDAPLTEAADITLKYLAIRNFTSQVFLHLYAIVQLSTGSIAECLRQDFVYFSNVIIFSLK